MQAKNRLLAWAAVAGVCLLLAVVPPAEGAVDFEPAVNYALSNLNPNWVVAGDFNGDSKLDLATANFPPNSSGSVSVLLGNGNGTFGTATSYPTAWGSISVVVGDFNGDGKLDLATANYGGNNVSILLGNGDGTFRTGTNLPVGTWPYSVAVGDFNRDGKLDLVTANNGSNVNTGISDMSILLGNGDGTFHFVPSFPLVNRPTRVAVGDFNGDGKLDAALSGFDFSGVIVVLGNGDGTFGGQFAIPVLSTPRSVAVGDFNGDGKLDLATASRSAATVGVLLGNGNATFGVPAFFPVAAAPESVTVADVNGDGKLDLVAAGRGDSVSVLLGNGDGIFGPSTNFAVGRSARSVAVGDFNRDGKPDLVTANNTSSDVSVLLSGDNTAPVINCGNADGLWHASDVSIACTAQDSGVGLANPADANFLLTTNVPPGTETSNTATGTRSVCDRNNHCATAGPIPGNKVDKKKPSMSCSSADEYWHPGNLSVACTASDGGSGLALAGDTGFSLLTNLPNGAESANATGVTRNVCDAVNNCTLATVPSGVKVDRKAPSIIITAPEATRYRPRQGVVASYSCADGGSGVILCMGPVPSRDPIDLFLPGRKTFTVFAVDKAGNLSSQTVNYEVGGPAAPGP